MCSDSYRVSVIIPILNNWQLTQNCLTSLRATTNGESLEVIIVDNGSSDETAKELLSFGQNLFGKDFKRIRFEENRNFAPACNAGAKVAKGNFLFFLNNDTELLPNWLPPLLKEFEITPHLGAVGPLLMYPDKTVQHLGITFHPIGQVSHLYHDLPISHPLVQRKRFFQALTAAALLIPRNLFLQKGEFDEQFVNGFEDLDLGVRLTAQGYKLTCVPESKIIHLESKTPNRFMHNAQNSFLFNKKCHKPLFHFMDMPDLVAADGYEIRILPALQAQIALPQEKTQQMIPNSDSFNALECFDLVKKEPYWLEGYSLLSDYLEQSGDWKTALSICGMQGKYTYYSLEMFERLLRIERHLNLDTTQLEQKIANEIRLICDPQCEQHRQAMMKFLSEGTPAQKALLPQFIKAGREARLIRAKYAEKTQKFNSQ